MVFEIYVSFKFAFIFILVSAFIMGAKGENGNENAHH